jgi:hypothetical protein
MIAFRNGRPQGRPFAFVSYRWSANRPRRNSRLVVPLPVASAALFPNERAEVGGRLTLAWTFGSFSGWLESAYASGEDHGVGRFWTGGTIKQLQRR